ncbi:MAG: hypothetical protein AAGF45_10420 [Pseudomonadota bacterium]
MDDQTIASFWSELDEMRACLWVEVAQNGTLSAFPAECLPDKQKNCVWMMPEGDALRRTDGVGRSVHLIFADTGERLFAVATGKVIAHGSADTDGNGAQSERVKVKLEKADFWPRPEGDVFSAMTQLTTTETATGFGQHRTISFGR